MHCSWPVLALLKLLGHRAPGVDNCATSPDVSPRASFRNQVEPAHSAHVIPDLPGQTAVHELLRVRPPLTLPQAATIMPGSTQTPHADAATGMLVAM